MSKASLAVGLLMITSVFLVTLTILPGDVGAATRYVGGGGPGNYTTIQEAIDDSDPGDIVYVHNGTYYENLEVYKTLSLVGEDRNTTIVNGGGSGDVVLITADWVNITGFTMTNSGEPGGNAGIELDSVEKCFIANNNVSGNWNGILLSGSSNNTVAENIVSYNINGIYLAFSSNNAITNNTISSNRWGIYVHTSGNSTIADNSVTYNQNQGIRLWVSDGAIIVGNNLSSNKMGIESYSCAHASLTRNRISSNSWFGIHIQSSTRIGIADNNVSENDWGIWIESSTSITFTGNIFANDGILLAGNDPVHYDSHNITTDNLVYNLPIYYYKNCNDVMIDAVSLGQLLVVNCANVTVSNVSIAGTDVGIEMAFVEDAIITGGNLSSNEKRGLFAYYSVNITATDSDFSRNEIGVRLIGSNVTVTNNSVSSNKYGIQINSCDISVVGNKISNNVGGIRVDNSSALTITGNNVSSNINFGIRLLGSTNITVYHNNIVNNTIQAVDGAGNENSWDNGYPSGGNYWSDYTGVDNCSGPNQDNCPDPDGIGDTPYVIDADSQDRYPLMLPVKTAFPRAPSNLQTTLSGSDLENITLTWTLSPDDGAGNQLVTEYAIWSGTTHNPGGSGYELIASLPNGTSEFTDVMVGEGNPNSYYYRVCAVDSRNNTACAENQAGKFTHLLSQGPNLISIPLIQLNESIEYVLQTVDYDKAWVYDSSSQEWKWHMTYKEYRRGLWNVNHTMGLWVNVTGDWSLTVAGSVPAQTMIHLHSGWNLVGFPSSNTTYTVADLKADTGATRVEGLETMPPFPPHFLRVLGDADMLLAGEAYWVKVDADTIWTVEMS